MSKLVRLGSIILISGLMIVAVPLTLWRQNFLTRSQIILPNISIDNLTVGGLTREQALDTINKIYTNHPLTIRFTFAGQEIAKLPASKIDYQLPKQMAVDQAFSIGRNPGLTGLYQQIALTLGWEKVNFALNPSYNHDQISDLLDELNSAYQKPAVDARFDFADNRVQAFKVDENGFRLDTDAALADFNNQIKAARFQKQTEIKIKIPKQIVYAQTRLKDINNLGITELIAVGSSKFAGSIPERVHNVAIGANRLNGIIIKSGETFSFNEALGEISGRTGFAPAYVIKNGKTVLDDGGGICQVSTTMFRAALNAGLPIIERTAHAYRVGYYEQDAKPGLDATIYQPSVDLKFKNDYQSALLIQATVNEETLEMSFALYGQKDNRQVDLSDITLWNIAPPPPPEYVDDFTLPEGVTKQVDWAAPGTSSKFTYRVTYPNNEVKEQEFISNYRPWKAVYLVGKKT